MDAPSLAADSQNENRSLRVVIAYHAIGAGSLRPAPGIEHLTTMNTLLIEENPATRPASGREFSPPPVSAKAPRLLTMGESRRRILFVDDHAQLRELSQEVLVQSGYEVDTAADGTEAWTALHEEDYHLLITDNQMPRLTGLELIHKVRAEHITVPVILVSGTLALLPPDDLARLECEAVLAKPFTTAQLVSAVENVLRAAAGPRTTTGLSLPAMEESQIRSRPHRRSGINE